MNKFTTCFFAAAISAMFLAPVQAGAQSLKDAKKTFQSGGWSVLRSVDQMTDKATCTGIYKADYGIQLTPAKLFLNVSGGIQTVTLRFDDSPANQMRLATSLEKEIRAVILDDNEFTQALASKRIRYQVLTLVRGVATGDIDLTGAMEAQRHITDGCPDVKSQ